MKLQRVLGTWGSLLLLGAGGACSSSKQAQDVGPTVNSGELPANFVVPSALTMIDDFEIPSPSGTVPAVTNPPFYGGWYTFDDGSLDSAGDGGADPNKQVEEVVALDQPHDTLPMKPPSAHAFHLHGGPYTGPWGSGVTGQLNAGAPFDASGFQGVIFWAKRGSSAASSTMRMGLPTIDDWSPMFGICKSPPTTENDGCSDDFRVTLTLADDWHVYKIPFAAMHQLGYGYRPPNGFDKANVLGVNFYNRQEEPFDQWIDDLAFYK